tara:strand:- start:194 stop:1243 length:1050 start_codon:yes stop_codon:yes gene_type:complete
MPVYNGQKFLGAAIESILNQTFTDFEFLIVDDLSTDVSVDIIKTYDDQRIRLYENYKNLGQAETMNRGLKLAKGKYIARMDQDDIAISLRLEKQVGYFKAHPNLGVLGTHVRIVDEARGTNAVRSRPRTNYENQWRLLYVTSVMHPSVMFRRGLFLKYGGYNNEYSPAEDYEYWSRLSQFTEIHQLPDVLMKLRIHEANTSISNRSNQLKNTLKIRISNINRLFAHQLESTGLKHIVDYISGNYSSSPSWWLTVSSSMASMYQLFCFDKVLTRDEVNWIANDWIRLLKKMPLKYRIIVFTKFIALRTIVDYKYFRSMTLQFKNILSQFSEGYKRKIFHPLSTCWLILIN